MVAGDVPTAMLLAYEEGIVASPGERGLILLRLAARPAPDDELSAIPVGQRDAMLLGLYRGLFGDLAQATVVCPRCGEQLESDVPLAALLAEAPGEAPRRFTFECGAGTISYRLPNAGDLAVVGAMRGLEAAAAATRSLALRCLLDQTDTEKLSEEDEVAFATALASTLASSDPLAQILLAMDCPACALRWEAAFDIVEFLWRRIEEQVSAVLRDVHLIACHYGWAEREILALTPFRRRRYLELIGA